MDKPRRGFYRFGNQWFQRTEYNSADIGLYRKATQFLSSKYNYSGFKETTVNID